MIVVHAAGAGLMTALALLWDSLFGLIFGFLLSAFAQVVLTPAAMQAYLGPNLRGILYGAGFGIISSSCSYGSSAAARGFYQRGADARSVFAFLISSTNMNVAILILFWSLLGWRFAFAEFFGGIIIIAIVTGGFTLLFGTRGLERLRRENPSADVPGAGVVSQCPICDMEGEPEFSAEYGGRAYYACGPRHQREFLADPQRYATAPERSTWRAVAKTAWNDVMMLRNELAIGYLLAGFAAALVSPQWLAHALQTVASVPYAGYVLLLALGLLIAVLTFVCSMGNVPIARFLANAGIPLGANTAFIYGDLLVPPLIAIYLKSFPRRIAWTFVALFAVGAMIAGGIMGATIGHMLGGFSMGSMRFNDRLTVVLNVFGILAALTVALGARFSALTENAQRA